MACLRKQAGDLDRNRPNNWIYVSASFKDRAIIKNYQVRLHILRSIERCTSVLASYGKLVRRAHSPDTDGDTIGNTYGHMS